MESEQEAIQIGPVWDLDIDKSTLILDVDNLSVSRSGKTI